ncbi:hypothetical protein FS842_006874 [Serendipita sp. 407]|nr:hypothetical protein FS842_006874 [Serendipita sp. 407]
MALATATQLHFPTSNGSHDPSWNDSIVPVLRQRLQNESQILAKRISTHSISPAAAAAVKANSPVDERTANDKSSAIPRPSGPPPTSSSTPSSDAPARKRQRTNSSPYNTRLPVPQPTRIPKMSAKPSGSYHPYRPSNLGTSAASKVQSRGANNVDPPSPLFDSPSIHTSRGARIGANQPGSRGYIRDEEPPFPNSASTSTEFHYEQTRLMHSSSIRDGLHGRSYTTGASSMDHSERPSIDEEPSENERPFEHWYRGEAARNGGVGELRIAKAEMMEIAQFGHRTAAASRYSPLGMNTTGGLRRRAGSVDEKRDSWVMDDAALKLSKVIDESPLTDLEGDDYTTEGERMYSIPSTSISAGMHSGRGIRRDGTLNGEDPDKTLYHDEDTTMSTAVSGIHPSTSSRTTGSTLGNVPQGQKSVQSPGKSSGSTEVHGSVKVPLGNNNGVPSSNSKSKLPASAKSKPKSKATAKGTNEFAPQGAQDEAENRDGVEKIPYRLPPSKGNWDDIVLPAVTKKMGIEGYGLKSEGGGILEISEEVRKRMSAIHPPVPGLFGYDPAKYKAARPEEDIHMADLTVVQPPSPPHTPKARPTAVTPPPEIPGLANGRNSPLAFSHYQTNLQPTSEKGERRKSGVPAITISPPSADEHAKYKRKMEEDKHSGCCGCIIM